MPKSEAWCKKKRMERAPHRKQVMVMKGDGFDHLREKYPELLCPHCLFFYDCGLPPVCRDCGHPTTSKPKPDWRMRVPKNNADGALSREQLAHLADYNVIYPWSPWQSLDLIDALEDQRKVIEKILHLVEYFDFVDGDESKEEGQYARDANLTTIAQLCDKALAKKVKARKR
jgi:hypothetical protein